MKFDDVIKQADTSINTICRILPITWQLIFQPGKFFWDRSANPEFRKREATELFVFSVAWLACLYYLVVASVRPVKSLEIYLFSALVFNVSYLVCMTSIYALLARAVCGPGTPFMLHFWNGLCTTPILCLIAFATQDYSAAWTRHALEGQPTDLGNWGAIAVISGYLLIARAMYAALRENVKASRFKAATVAWLGFAITMLFVAGPLTTGSVRLLKVMTT